MKDVGRGWILGCAIPGVFLSNPRWHDDSILATDLSCMFATRRDLDTGGESTVTPARLYTTYNAEHAEHAEGRRGAAKRRCEGERIRL